MMRRCTMVVASRRTGSAAVHLSSDVLSRTTVATTIVTAGLAAPGRDVQQKRQFSASTAPCLARKAKVSTTSKTTKKANLEEEEEDLVLAKEKARKLSEQQQQRAMTSMSPSAVATRLHQQRCRIHVYNVPELESEGGGSVTKIGANVTNFFNKFGKLIEDRTVVVQNKKIGESFLQLEYALVEEAELAVSKAHGSTKFHSLAKKKKTEGQKGGGGGGGTADEEDHSLRVEAAPVDLPPSFTVKVKGVPLVAAAPHSESPMFLDAKTTSKKVQQQRKKEQLAAVEQVSSYFKKYGKILHLETTMIKQGPSGASEAEIRRDRFKKLKTVSVTKEAEFVAVAYIVFASESACEKATEATDGSSFFRDKQMKEAQVRGVELSDDELLLPDLTVETLKPDDERCQLYSTTAATEPLEEKTPRVEDSSKQLLAETERSVTVSHLPRQFSVQRSKVVSFFAQFGAVHSVRWNFEEGKEKEVSGKRIAGNEGDEGICFIVFEDKASARKAADNANGSHHFHQDSEGTLNEDELPMPISVSAKVRPHLFQSAHPVDPYKLVVRNVPQSCIDQPSLLDLHFASFPGEAARLRQPQQREAALTTSSQEQANTALFSLKTLGDAATILQATHGNPVGARNGDDGSMLLDVHPRYVLPEDSSLVRLTGECIQESSTEPLRSLMAQFGTITRVSVVPSEIQESHDESFEAFVQFDSPLSAHRAREELHKTKQPPLLSSGGGSESGRETLLRVVIKPARFDDDIDIAERRKENELLHADLPTRQLRVSGCQSEEDFNNLLSRIETEFGIQLPSYAENVFVCFFKTQTITTDSPQHAKSIVRKLKTPNNKEEEEEESKSGSRMSVTVIKKEFRRDSPCLSVQGLAPAHATGGANLIKDLGVQCRDYFSQWGTVSEVKVSKPDLKSNHQASQRGYCATVFMSNAEEAQDAAEEADGSGHFRHLRQISPKAFTSLHVTVIADLVTQRQKVQERREEQLALQEQLRETEEQRRRDEEWRLDQEKQHAQALQEQHEADLQAEAEHTALVEKQQKEEEARLLAEIAALPDEDWVPREERAVRVSGASGEESEVRAFFGKFGKIQEVMFFPVRDKIGRWNCILVYNAKLAATVGRQSAAGSTFFRDAQIARQEAAKAADQTFTEAPLPRKLFTWPQETRLPPVMTTSDVVVWNISKHHTRTEDVLNFFQEIGEVEDMFKWDSNRGANNTKGNSSYPNSCDRFTIRYKKASDAARAQRMLTGSTHFSQLFQEREDERAATPEFKAQAEQRRLTREKEDQMTKEATQGLLDMDDPELKDDPTTDQGMNQHSVDGSDDGRHPSPPPQITVESARKRPPPPGCASIRVLGLPKPMDQNFEAEKEFFGRFGTILRIGVSRDLSVTYVDYATPEDAFKAVVKTNSSYFFNNSGDGSSSSPFSIGKEKWSVDEGDQNRLRVRHATLPPGVEGSTDGQFQELDQTFTVRIQAVPRPMTEGAIRSCLNKHFREHAELYAPEKAKLGKVKLIVDEYGYPTFFVDLDSPTTAVRLVQYGSAALEKYIKSSAFEQALEQEEAENAEDRKEGAAAGGSPTNANENDFDDDEEDAEEANEKKRRAIAARHGGKDRVSKVTLARRSRKTPTVNPRESHQKWFPAPVDEAAFDEDDCTIIVHNSPLATEMPMPALRHYFSKFGDICGLYSRKRQGFEGEEWFVEYRDAKHAMRAVKRADGSGYFLRRYAETVKSVRTGLSVKLVKGEPPRPLAGRGAVSKEFHPDAVAQTRRELVIKEWGGLTSSSSSAATKPTAEDEEAEGDDDEDTEEVASQDSEALRGRDLVIFLPSSEGVDLRSLRATLEDTHGPLATFRRVPSKQCCFFQFEKHAHNVNLAGARGIELDGQRLNVSVAREQGEDERLKWTHKNKIHHKVEPERLKRRDLVVFFPSADKDNRNDSSSGGVEINLEALKSTLQEYGPISEFRPTKSSRCCFFRFEDEKLGVPLLERGHIPFGSLNLRLEMAKSKTVKRRTPLLNGRDLILWFPPGSAGNGESLRFQLEADYGPLADFRIKGGTARRKRFFCFARFEDESIGNRLLRAEKFDLGGEEIDVKIAAGDRYSKSNQDASGGWVGGHTVKDSEQLAPSPAASSPDDDHVGLERRLSEGAALRRSQSMLEGAEW